MLIENVNKSERYTFSKHKADKQKENQKAFSKSVT